MMGIYPERRTIPRNTRYVREWVEEIEEPGVIRRRTVTAGEWIEERSDCFCCSCSDFSSDLSCRNHGYYATRPCDRHNMPGSAGDDGVMPESVQCVLRSRSDVG